MILIFILAKLEHIDKKIKNITLHPEIIFAC